MKQKVNAFNCRFHRRILVPEEITDRTQKRPFILGLKTFSEQVMWENPERDRRTQWTKQVTHCLVTKIEERGHPSEKNGDEEAKDQHRTIPPLKE